MRVKLVSVEQGITALGFRRIAAIARSLNPDAEIEFVTTGNLYTPMSHLFPSLRSSLTPAHIERIADELAEADLIAFSSMTPSAPYVEQIAAAVKRRRPSAFLIWGGSHCILNAEKAIEHVDAVFTGEGEVPFSTFYRLFEAGEDYLGTAGIWFKTKEGIRRNERQTLNTSAELGSFPHLFYGMDCTIYDLRKGAFRPFQPVDFVTYNGLAYRTVWTLGCPFSCAYCANDAFIGLDKGYREIRYPSVEYLIEELETARKTHPYVCTVVFYDDNFIAVPLDVLRAFATEYKQRIGLPFVVFGLHPNLITEEKIELLAEAGMNRGRMGIQSGCARTLGIYNRPTSLAKVSSSAGILSAAARKYHMIRPAYDIISDNPLETREDVTETLKFLFDLPRPYTLTVFSLRVFPKTRLQQVMEERINTGDMPDESSYLDTRPSMANVALYLLAIRKPPRAVFNWMLRSVRGFTEAQRYYPALMMLSKTAYLVSRGIQHLVALDTTTMAGKWAFLAWRWGIIRPRDHRR